MIYAVDGSNVCFWGKAKGDCPSLMILLELLVELRRRRMRFLCFFDAATRHKLNLNEQDVYLKLIYDHQHCFTEVTGGVEADRFILQWADNQQSAVITNDRYQKYADEYSWLRPGIKLIKANIAGDTLLLDKLKITKKLSSNFQELAKKLDELLTELKSEKLSTDSTQPPAVQPNQAVRNRPKLSLIEPVGNQLAATVQKPDKEDSKLSKPVEPIGRDKLPDKKADETVSQGPFVLHLIFDRTTLDSNFWTLALAAFDNAASERSTINEPKKWNQYLRQNLASALIETLPELQQEVAVDLWWFADVERAGITHQSNIAAPARSYGQAHGQLGSFDPTYLTAQLLGPSFNYSPGLDLFDAVDEALSAVAKSIKSQPEGSRRQRAILIVADSPPPPKDQDDLIWQHLVEGPPRTNARHSPKFHEALSELRRMKTPIGWLFMRATVPPSDEVEFSQYLHLFPHYQTLKERILEALLKIDGLLVEGCVRPEEIPRSLRKLFQQFKANQL